MVLNNIKHFCCMHKNLTTIEEMIAEEMFLAWFYRESSEKIQAFESWLAENPGRKTLAAEATNVMKNLSVAEAPVSSSRVESAYHRLNAKLEELENDMAPVVPMKRSRN